MYVTNIIFELKPNINIPTITVHNSNGNARNLLDPKNTIVYLYSTRSLYTATEDDFVEFKADEMEKYSVLPKETRDYYKEKYAEGIKPFVFYRAPHILYKGTINIKNFRVIE